MRNTTLRWTASFVWLVTLAMTVPVWCWGNEGHRAVALVAQAQLSVPAKAQIQSLIGTALPAIATCADEVRAHERNPQEFTLSPACLHVFPTPQPTGTANWHFINLDVGKPDLSDAAMDQLCHDDCVVAKILSFQSVLASKVTPASSRMQALAFLVHFVGDVHQPLHAAERNKDAGGNLVTVGFPTTDGPTGPLSEETLHAVWDTAVIQRISRDETALVAAIAAQIAAARKEKVPAQLGPWVHVWSRQSEALARVSAYQDRGVNIPTSQHDLSLEYEKAAAGVIETQIARAGFRLATLINLALK
jgi:hypothetical protein